jgi:plastocyanin
MAAGLLLVACGTQAAELAVSMEGASYVPAALSARIGDTPRFRNNDDVNHNVFVPTVGFAVDLGKQDPGKEAVLALGKAGRFEVECVNHEGMVMTVGVQPWGGCCRSLPRRV